MGPVKRKLRGSRGETILETLLSMLVISLIFIFLVNAIVTSQRINGHIKNDFISPSLSGKETVGVASISIDGTTLSGGGQVYALKDDEGDTRYYYYEYSQS